MYFDKVQKQGLVVTNMDHALDYTSGWWIWCKKESRLQKIRKLLGVT